MLRTPQRAHRVRAVHFPRTGRDKAVNGKGIVSETLEKRLLELEAENLRLRAVEDRYRQCFRNVKDVIVQVDAGLGITGVSPSVESVLGYRPEDFTGRTLSDLGLFLTQESHARVLADAKRVLEGTTVPNAVYRFVASDGAVRLLELSGAPMMQDGDVVGLIAVGRDITDRRRAEEALRENERRYKLVTDKMTDIVWIADMNLRTIYVTPSVETVLGYSQEERMALDIREKLTPESVAAGMEVLERELALEKRGDADPARATTILLEYMHKDGSTRWMETIITSLRDDRGSLTGIHGVSRDVTDRKRAEEALRRSEEYFRTITENSSDILLITDEQGIISYVTPSAERLIGYRPDELVGMNTFEMIVPEDLPRAVEDYRKALGTRDIAIPNRFRIRRRNGVERVMEGVGINLMHNPAIAGFVMSVRDVTDQRRAEEALKESEHRFRQLFDQMSSCVAVYEAVDDGGDFVIRDFNRAAERLEKVRREEILGRRVTEVFPGVRAFGILDVFQRVLRTGEPEDHDVSFYRDERIAGWRENHVFRLPSGEIVAIYDDVTARKQGEEFLRDSEQQLSMIINSFPGLVARIDRDYRYRFVSNQYELLYGMTPDRILGRTVAEVIGEETFQRVRPSLERAFGGETVTLETWNQNIAGETMYGLLTCMPDLNPDGTIRGTIAVIVDISERKRAEETLRETQRQLADIIDFLPDATFVIDQAGKVIAWNRAIEDLTGVRKEDMLGRGDREYAVPFYGERRPILIDLVLQPEEEARVRYNSVRWQGNVLIGESFIPDLRGKEVHLLGTASILYDTKGSVVGAIETMRDITDRIRLEAQFRQAHKMEAIGTLAGGVAHDFNNILGAIIGYTELYKEQVRDRPKVYHAMGEVLKAAGRARDLVQQILTFSRRAVQEKRPTAVVPIVREVAKFIRASLPTTIEIRQNLNASSDVILADAGQIHQVLMNLCTNAGQAMAEKGGVLEIGLEEFFIGEAEELRFPSLHAGRYLKLNVRDTGRGIRAENLEKIFEPYFTTKGKGEGTGLGLAVVHGIVKDHGGDVKVYSEPGRGTLFSVYLPLMDSPADAIPFMEEASLPGAGERILFVDDEEILASLGKEQLEDLGYRVVAETDPVHAIEVFRRDPDAFDLVITDKTMPRMTGFDVARELRAIRADIPVILCSGFQGQTDLEEQAALGIRFFMIKPLRIQVLAEAIRNVLDKIG